MAKQAIRNRVDLGVNPNDIYAASKIAELSTSDNKALFQLGNTLISATDSIMTSKSDSNMLEITKNLQSIQMDYSAQLKNPEIYKDPALLQKTKDDYMAKVSEIDKYAGTLTLEDKAIKNYNYMKEQTNQRFSIEIDENLKRQQFIDDRSNASNMSLQNYASIQNLAAQGNVAGVDREFKNRELLYDTQIKLGMVDEGKATYDFSKELSDTAVALDLGKFKTNVIDNGDISTERKIQIIDKKILELNNEENIQKASSQIGKDYKYANQDMLANSMRNSFMSGSQSLTSIKNALIDQQNKSIKAATTNNDVYNFNNSIRQDLVQGDLYSSVSKYMKATKQPMVGFNRSALYNNEDFIKNSFDEKTWKNRNNVNGDLVFIEGVLDKESINSIKNLSKDNNLSEDEKYKQAADIIRVSYGTDDPTLAINNVSVETNLDRKRLLNEFGDNLGWNEDVKNMYNEKLVKTKTFLKSEKATEDISNKSVNIQANYKDMEESQRQTQTAMLELQTQKYKADGIPIPAIDKKTGENKVLAAIFNKREQIPADVIKKAISDNVALIKNEIPNKNILETTSKILNEASNSPIIKYEYYKFVIANAVKMYPDRFTGSPDAEDIPPEILRDRKVIEAATKDLVNNVLYPEYRDEIGKNKYNTSPNIEKLNEMLTIDPNKTNTQDKTKMDKSKYIKDKNMGGTSI